MIKRILAIASMLACMVSCRFAEAEYLDPVELGGTPKEVHRDSAEGWWSFDVFSNRPYKAEIVKGQEWLKFESDVPNDGYNTVTLTYTVNTGFSRLGQVVLTSGSRSDTLNLYQAGQYTRMVELSPAEVAIPAEGGTAELDLATNVAAHDLKFESSHSSVQSMVYENCHLFVTVAPNNSRDVRHIRITASTTDECGVVTSSTAVVNQPIIK